MFILDLIGADVTPAARTSIEVANFGPLDWISDPIDWGSTDPDDDDASASPREPPAPVFKAGQIVTPKPYVAKTPGGWGNRIPKPAGPRLPEVFQFEPDDLFLVFVDALQVKIHGVQKAAAESSATHAEAALVAAQKAAAQRLKEETRAAAEVDDNRAVAANQAVEDAKAARVAEVARKAEKKRLAKEAVTAKLAAEKREAEQAEADRLLNIARKAERRALFTKAQADTRAALLAEPRTAERFWSTAEHITLPTQEVAAFHIEAELPSGSYVPITHSTATQKVLDLVAVPKMQSTPCTPKHIGAVAVVTLPGPDQAWAITLPATVLFVQGDGGQFEDIGFVIATIASDEECIAAHTGVSLSQLDAFFTPSCDGCLHKSIAAYEGQEVEIALTASELLDQLFGHGSTLRVVGQDPDLTGDTTTYYAEVHRRESNPEVNRRGSVSSLNRRASSSSLGQAPPARKAVRSRSSRLSVTALTEAMRPAMTFRCLAPVCLRTKPSEKSTKKKKVLAAGETVEATGTTFGPDGIECESCPVLCDLLIFFKKK